MTDNLVENAAAAAQSAELREEHPSPGVQLRAAREAAGLTLEELSARLRMTGNKLELLERDEYDRLPSALYVRGYIRNACKELGIDPVPVLEAFSGYSAAEEESRAIIAHVSKASVIDESGRGGYGVLALVALVLVAGAFWWFQGRELTDAASDIVSPAAERAVSEMALDSGAEPAAAMAEAELAEAEQAESAQTFEVVAPEISEAQESVQSATPESSQEVPAEPADAGTVQAAAEGQIEVMAAEPEVEIAAELESDAAATEASDTTEAPAEAAESARVAEPTPAQAAVSGPVETVQLSFAEDAWVEVKDASGSVLLARLQPAGSRVALEGQPPFSLMLGHAAVTEVRYRGQLVPSDPIGGRRTHRMTLGE
ncbi:helix-turn-helix domain-containing protein [Microbulbifer guangxiensis]|uniref:helix-turn-helix domain-containing protein n=1 Tax=Microbulbifer guangxiensis TaxID=2904249 RepID=UPI001F15CA8D|nr:RodZ domain-containing protein [Microbulbifer guangxiensis]